MMQRKLEGRTNIMTSTVIEPGADGLYHPATEAEVIALIALSRENGTKHRARGSTHSVAWSIYTDPVAGTPPNRTLEQAPPPGEINLAFDKMRSVDWVDEANGVVEVEPGINLGWDPQDPFGVSTLENSLLHQIFKRGWAVDTLGGITHQTLAGFTATGSAGGSTRYGWTNAIAFRVVDGTGNAEWIDQSHPQFDAFGTSMGLLGVVTKIRMQLVPMYNIQGTEVTTPITGPEAPVDLFGPGGASQPGLRQYLEETPYTRIVWWPQQGAERIQTWKAKRVPASNEDLVPYQQFTPDFGGQTLQFLGALIFVIVGNTSPLRIIKLIWQKVGIYLENLGFVLSQGNSSGLSRFLTFLLGCVLGIIALAIGSVLAFFNGLMRNIFAKLLPVFQPMTKPGEETTFSDWYWRSLCMDNTVSDGLLGTEFTEIWVPIQHAEAVMNLYQKLFEDSGDAATGYFSTEVYGGPPSKGWMHPGYTDGSDAYKDGSVRLDVYWYRDNKGIPNADEAFFEQYWQVLRDNDIPFRLHWGKFVPRFDFADWAAYYKASLPRFDDFMALRATRDPDGIFFTEYWRLRLTGSV